MDMVKTISRLTAERISLISTWALVVVVLVFVVDWSEINDQINNILDVAIEILEEVSGPIPE